jgi:hypothetical protein
VGENRKLKLLSAFLACEIASHISPGQLSDFQPLIFSLPRRADGMKPKTDPFSDPFSNVVKSPLTPATFGSHWVHERCCQK